MQNLSELRINATRLESSIEQMGRIGFDPRTNGRTRLALSNEDKEARDLLCSWLTGAGLEVRIDGMGNIFGLREGTDKDALPVMMGSHIDTVKNAGMFDGVYGVLGALEVVRTLDDNNVKTKRPIVVAAFTNEEGARFQLDMMGSIFYTNAKPAEELYSVSDDNGITVRDELNRIGYMGNSSVPAGNYFELHIEQGPKLDAEKVQIGVVEGIQGLAWWEGFYKGEANHAGSTPMDMRHDALIGVANLAIETEKLADRLGNGSVATMGRIRPEPDVINIVPGKCRFTIDFRQFDPTLFESGKSEVEALIDKCANERSLGCGRTRIVDAKPVIFDKEMVSTVERSALELGFTTKRMYSGAGHDAQFMCAYCPTTMIFVPSRGGLSHCPEEWTNIADAENGCNVLMHSVLKLDGAYNQRLPRKLI